MYEGSMEAFKRIRIYSDSPLVNKEHPEPQLPPLSLERAASLPLPAAESLALPAGGRLGYDVLLALRALKVGEAVEAGLAIVALAIALDRLSQAMARRQARVRGPPHPRVIMRNYGHAYTVSYCL